MPESKISEPPKPQDPNSAVSVKPVQAAAVETYKEEVLYLEKTLLGLPNRPLFRMLKFLPNKDLKKIQQIFQRAKILGNIIILDRYKALSQIDKNTQLIKDTKKKQFKKVEFLLQNGANVNFCTLFGLTALIYASINNDKSLILLLLDHGANKNHALEQLLIWRPFTNKKNLRLLNHNISDKEIREARFLFCIIASIFLIPLWAPCLGCMTFFIIELWHGRIINPFF